MQSVPQSSHNTLIQIHKNSVMVFIRYYIAHTATHSCHGIAETEEHQAKLLEWSVRE